MKHSVLNTTTHVARVEIGSDFLITFSFREMWLIAQSWVIASITKDLSFVGDARGIFNTTVSFKTEDSHDKRERSFKNLLASLIITPSDYSMRDTNFEVNLESGAVSLLEEVIESRINDCNLKEGEDQAYFTDETMIDMKMLRLDLKEMRLSTLEMINISNEENPPPPDYDYAKHD